MISHSSGFTLLVFSGYTLWFFILAISCVIQGDVSIGADVFLLFADVTSSIMVTVSMDLCTGFAQFQW